MAEDEEREEPGPVEAWRNQADWGLAVIELLHCHKHNTHFDYKSNIHFNPSYNMLSDSRKLLVK